MSALPHPDLAPGPHRDLVEALHDLHHRAGWPSLRRLAGEAGVSHTTVSKAFSLPVLPTWGTLELLVEAMAGDTNTFHDLWLAASSPTSNGATSKPRIAGRRVELAAVRRHLETGTGLLLVTGEAGIGKTTLVEAAAETCGSFTAHGSCLPLSRQVPYLPIADALRMTHESDGGQRVKVALADCPAYVVREVARLVPELHTGFADDGTDDAEDYARQRLLGALRSILAALASSDPFAVVLEDLHWADANTLDLLEHLVGQRARVPVVATWRADDPATAVANTDWFSRVRRLPDVAEVALVALTRDETAAQLAHQALGTDVDTIYQRSRGHPLFTAQLAAHVGDDLPLRLADLLDMRLGELEGPEWLLARALGVADRPLELAVLASATHLELPDAVDGLRTLSRRHLLSPDEAHSASLGHPLLAEAVRRRLVAGEGAAQHREIAEALAVGDHPEPAEIAEHWQAAGDRVREAEWRVAAARASAQRHDAKQEAQQWLRALETWPGTDAGIGDPPATRPEAYLAGMDALKVSFQWDRAAQMSDAADVELGEVDDVVRAELLRRAAEYVGGRQGLSTGLALIDQALELYRSLPLSRGHIWALARKETLLIHAGTHDGARELARTMADLSASVGDPPLQRWATMRLAWHTAAHGELTEAMRTFTDTDAMCPAGSDPYGDLQRAVLATDALLLCGGTPEEVEAAGRPGLSLAEDLDIDSTMVELLLSNVTCGLIRAGQVAEAADLVGSDRLSAPVLDRWVTHLVGAVIDALCGRLDRASGVTAQIWQGMATNLSTDPEFMVLAGIIDTWNRTPENTLPRILNALDLLVDGTPIRLLAPALVTAAQAAADVAAAQGGLPEGHRAMLRDVHTRAGLGTPAHRHDLHLQAHASTWDLELARIDGEELANGWVQAATLWDRLSRPHDAAYCRWRGAQVALRDGQGTLAARLLKRAATDSREHVPLNRAIAATLAGAR